MIELTRQEQQALDAGPEPRWIDPRPQKSYVLVEVDVPRVLHVTNNLHARRVRRSAWGGRG